MATQKFKRASQLRLHTLNPIFEEGEPIFVTDSGRLKIGDGLSHYDDLDFIGVGTIDIGVVTTLPPGSSAHASITAVGDDLLLNLDIPRGYQGLTGNQVLQILDRAADYTAALPDANYDSFLSFSKASAQAFTIPPNSGVAFPIGSVIWGHQSGAGQVTITPGAGVTLHGSGGKFKTAAQYSVFRVIQVAANVWLAAGDLST